MEKDWQEAALAGDVVRIKALLEASGDARDSRDRYGQTAVMLAAVHGREAVVRALIEAGADLDVTAKYGLSAIMLAVVNHHEAVARALAEAGADLTLRGTGDGGFFGKSAADLAEENGQSDLARVLRAAEARQT